MSAYHVCLSSRNKSPKHLEQIFRLPKSLFWLINSYMYGIISLCYDRRLLNQYSLYITFSLKQSENELVNICTLPHWSQIKMTFCRRHFQMHFAPMPTSLKFIPNGINQIPTLHIPIVKFLEFLIGIEWEFTSITWLSILGNTCASLVYPHYIYYILSIYRGRIQHDNAHNPIITLV